MLDIKPEDVWLVKVSGDREDALKQLAEPLFKKGYVLDSYADALIERERKYPTGLTLPSGVNVALPHADGKHVNKPGLLIGVPDHPILFHLMDDSTKTANINLILLLVIKSADGYVRFLSDLTTLFQQQQFIQFVKERKFDELRLLIQNTAMISSS
jgi:PTS system galactitol-specific IIA component